MNLMESLILLAAYLIGSFPTAMIVARLFSLSDPTQYGSKNPGATNMLRIAGKKAAIMTLLGDLFKGTFALSLTVAVHSIIDPNIALSIDFQLVVLGSVLIGHMLPVFNGFVGGKGVATLIGGLIMINVYLCFMYIVTWFVVAKLFKLSSLSAIVATIMAPIYAWLIMEDFNHDQTLMLLIGICLLVLLRHHQNIHRLVTGNEK